MSMNIISIIIIIINISTTNNDNATNISVDMFKTNDTSNINESRRGSGTYSSVVRVSASGGGGPGFNPHHVKLSGLEVRPLKVSGGSPVHLRSKHQELVGKTLWVKT